MKPALAVGLALALASLGGTAYFLRADGAPMEFQTPPEPTSPDGLLGRWVALRGGFTGVEARTPVDAALTMKWPPGAVVELTLGEDGGYQLIQVVAASGAVVEKTLAREEGTFQHDAAQGLLTLSPKSRTVVRRLNAEQTTQTDQSPAGRVYRVASAPLLTLAGACIPGVEPGDCTWALERRTD